MCAPVIGAARLSTEMATQSDVVVGKINVAEPKASRSPCRQSGGAAPLHSLPPFRTANSGTPWANAPVDTKSAPTITAAAQMRLRIPVIVASRDLLTSCWLHVERIPNRPCGNSRLLDRKSKEIVAVLAGDGR